MKCDMKTMLKATAVLGLFLAIAYLTVPAAHAFILASAPILVALICPASMLFMMNAMNKNGSAESSEPMAAPRIHDAGPDRVCQPPAPTSSRPTSSGGVSL